MMATSQSSLFDEVGAATLGDLRSAHRTPLDSTAWIDHLPNWLAGSQSVFDTVRAAGAWRAERRSMYDRVVDVPRLICWYGPDETPPHPLLATARSALTAHYRNDLPEGFSSIAGCLYRDGRDSVAWHGDTIGRGRTEDTLVAIISLGAPRALLLRPLGGGRSLRFMLGHGDLLVMGGSCQRTWQHAIAKTRRPVGPRVSIQLRPPGVA